MMQQHETDLQQMQRKAPPPALTSGGGKKKGPPLRRGKWTQEEEAYANRLIQEFKAGLLPLTDGTTLRTFLSKLLNCDPMRISKKFVGGNCIGKQVFRRRTADLNRLTPEQIQNSRAELSELERRFLDRVAQTNRVKSSGVGGSTTATSNPVGQVTHVAGQVSLKGEDTNAGTPSSPPWLQTPLGYKQGSGAAMAAANLAEGGGSRAAAAGRALLRGIDPSSLSKAAGSGLSSSGSAGLLAMAELQRRASQQSLLQNIRGQSAQNLLAALTSADGGGGVSMVNLANSSSASRLGLSGSNSIGNLMLKNSFSRDRLNQLAKDRGLSSTSLSNMIDRKNSFDALMSLDFQSLQSIDNLANLIQSGASSTQAPASGMKNWSADNSNSRNSLAGLAGGTGSTGSLSEVARRLASSGQMESLLRSFSSNNVKRGEPIDHNQSSSSNLQQLLQNAQSEQASSSMSSLLGGSRNGSSAASLANLLRENSSTGLTALRMQDGLNNRNSSVEDFLSLVAAGDIPHQDPSLLNVPLMHHQQNTNGDNMSRPGSAAAVLAQQRLLAQATGNPALANAIASRSFGSLRNLSGGLLKNNSAAALLARSGGDSAGSSMSLKRKLLELDASRDKGSAKKR
ncbi:unnamed protein product [Cylindrotheca closterium]|uniref:Uncharacterized protein n=1 Tax=Cylindrotheca closterium TaxID=2856 RepID=A0AAD2JIK6_9STRA|nr:unnamed protein product [Cylindrotheca closterium]